MGENGKHRFSMDCFVGQVGQEDLLVWIIQKEFDNIDIPAPHKPLGMLFAPARYSHYSQTCD